MRCLAVRQPWAWAIVAGAKDIENRTWSTDYRGLIVIQASSAKTVVNQLAKRAGGSLVPMSFAYSALIGVADLIDVVPLSEGLEANPWAWGPYCWRVANARAFAEPIAAKGKLNLYTLDRDLDRRVRDSMSEAQPVQRDRNAQAWIEKMSSIEDYNERQDGLFDNYVGLGDGGNALRIAERAVRERGTVDAYVDRAIANYIDGDVAAATVDMDHAIAMEPQHARALSVRGAMKDGLAPNE